VLVLVLSFTAMEGVSYAAHRWLMHGPGWGWHRSHHGPRRATFEPNDRFPLCFAVVGIVLFAAGRSTPALSWIASGITLYGVVYLGVHELYIHRRLQVWLPSNRYLEWLRAAHADHHRRGGEPYGMLLPLVRDRVSSGSARARL
jgi:beta-carotene 3-hydroxylase